jgi:hypothetical protein
MESKKETAVEWLEKIYLTTGIDRNVHFSQAKQMEKEQIVDAYNQGIWDSPMERKDDAEQYYELVYGNK